MTYSIKSVKRFDTPDGGGFNCTLYENGKKVAYVYDEGRGGGLYFDCVNGWDLPYQLERHKQDDLESMVYKLFDEWSRKKDEKRGIQLKRDFGYVTIEWRVQLPTLLKKYSNGLEAVQKKYDEVKGQGEEVLNTAYLASIGVNV